MAVLTLAVAPLPTHGSVIVAANDSVITAEAFASVGGQVPVSQTDSASTTFAADTTIPMTFGDEVVAHAEASGYGPPTLFSSADASADLDAGTSQAGGVVTVLASGSAAARVNQLVAYSGVDHSALADATLNLVLQLDSSYAYAFSTGPITIAPQVSGATYVSAYLADGSSTYFNTDTIMTGCDFGCAALPDPYEGSFQGVLGPGTYRLRVSATISEMQNVSLDDAMASFANAQLLLTPLGAEVPLPASLWLLGGALGALGWLKRQTPAGDALTAR